MIRWLNHWLSARVTVRLGAFADRRTQELHDAAIYLDFARRVALNVAARERARCVQIAVERNFVPEHLRLPAILQRQAA